MSSSDDENNNSNSNSEKILEDVNADISAVVENKNEMEEEVDGTKLFLGNLFKVVTTLYSYFIITLGVTFGLGIGLNIMGYGYQFRDTNGNFGFKIDTIQNMKIERQFQQVSKQYASQSSQSSNSKSTTEISPSSSSSFNLNDFFMRRPFLTTLGITGVVLAVESALNNNGNNSKGPPPS